MITFLFNFYIFIIPFIFFTKSSEIFEFNKIIVSYIFTILIVGVWVIKNILYKKFIFKRTALDIPLILFFIILIISTYFSINTRTSILGYYSRFNGGLLSFVSFIFLYWIYVASINADKTKKLINTILISSVLIAIYASLEHFNVGISCLFINQKIDTSCWMQDVQSRVFGTFGQPNWLAAWIVAIMPLAWAKLINTESNFYQRSWPSFAYILISALLFITLLFTKSRSGLLAFVIIDILFWLIIFIKNRKLYKKIFLINNLIYIIIIFIIGTPFNIRNNLPAQTDNSQILITPSSEIRKMVWKGAIEIWRNNLILGTGPETFAFSYYKYRPVEHNVTSEWNFTYNKAHNEYLNFAANTGTLGLATYLLIIIISLYIFINNIKNSKLYVLHAALLSGYVSLLITNFFGFSVSVTSLLFFIYPAFSISLENNNKIYINIKKIIYIQKLLILVIFIILFYLLLQIINYWRADYLYAKNTENNIKQAIDIHPNEPEYHNALAKIYFNSKNYKLAIYESNKTISLSPNNTKLLKHQALMYLDLAEIDKKYLLNANNIIKNIIKLAPTDAWGYYYLAKTELAMGNTNNSRTTVRKTIVMKPNYKAARKLLAYIYIQTDESEKAIYELKYILDYISSDDNEIKEMLEKLI